MTRKEEIINAGIAYTMSTRPNVIAGDAFADDDTIRQINRNKGFEDGAKWADYTMIHKTCDWLAKNYEDIGTRWMRGYKAEDLVEQFKDAIERNEDI